MIKLIYTKSIKQVLYHNNIIDINNYIIDNDIDKATFEYICFLETQNLEKNLNLEDLYLYDEIPLYYMERPTIFLKIKQILTCVLLLENMLKCYEKKYK